MIRLISLVSLSTALAIATTSCAHHQITKQRVAEGAATAAVITGLVLLAANGNCGDCNIGDTQRAALPPH